MFFERRKYIKKKKNEKKKKLDEMKKIQIKKITLENSKDWIPLKIIFPDSHDFNFLFRWKGNRDSATSSFSITRDTCEIRQKFLRSKFRVSFTLKKRHHPLNFLSTLSEHGGRDKVEMIFIDGEVGKKISRIQKRRRGGGCRRMKRSGREDVARVE